MSITISAVRDIAGRLPLAGGAEPGAVRSVTVPEVERVRPARPVPEPAAQAAAGVPQLDGRDPVGLLGDARAEPAAVVEQLEPGAAVGPRADARAVAALGVPELRGRAAGRLRPVAEERPLAARAIPHEQPGRGDALVLGHRQAVAAL